NFATVFASNEWSLDKKATRMLLNSILISNDLLPACSHAIYELENFKIHFINEGLIEVGDPVSLLIDEYRQKFKVNVEPWFSFLESLSTFFGVSIDYGWESN